MLSFGYRRITFSPPIFLFEFPLTFTAFTDLCLFVCLQSSVVPTVTRSRFYSLFPFIFPNAISRPRASGPLLYVIKCCISIASCMYDTLLLFSCNVPSTKLKIASVSPLPCSFLSFLSVFTPLFLLLKELLSSTKVKPNVSFVYFFCGCG